MKEKRYNTPQPTKDTKRYLLLQSQTMDTATMMDNKEIEIDDEYELEIEEDELENAQFESLEDESLPFSPHIKSFTLDPLLLREKHLFQRVNVPELDVVANVGDELGNLLYPTCNLKSPRDFLKRIGVELEDQMEFVESREHIDIPRIDRKNNKLKRNRKEYKIYGIIAPWNGKIVLVKVGIDGDGRRKGDYQLTNGQQYVLLFSFYNATSDIEKQMDAAFDRGIKQLLELKETPSYRKKIFEMLFVGAKDVGTRRPLAMHFVESAAVRAAGLQEHRHYNPNEFSIGTEEDFEERKNL